MAVNNHGFQLLKRLISPFEVAFIYLIFGDHSDEHIIDSAFIKFNIISMCPLSGLKKVHIFLQNTKSDQYFDVN